MGFLDFLKKDKAAAPAQANPVPPPPQSVDVNEVEKKIGLDAPPADMPNMGAPTDAPAELPDVGAEPIATTTDLVPDAEEQKSGSDPHPENPVPTASMMTTPLQNEDPDPSIYKDEDYEDVPVPPPSMQDPDFLTSAADDLAGQSAEQKDAKMAGSDEAPKEEKPEEKEEPKEEPKPEEKPAEAPAEPPKEEKPPVVESVPVPPKEEPKEEKPKEKAALELPDFTEEDIASVAPPKPPEPPVELAEPEQPDDVKPLDAHPAFGHLHAAMFLSSDAYFALTDDITSVRQTLRENDEVLREAAMQHEKGDDHLKRMAIEVNAIQENLLHIDASLFEE